MEKKMGFIKPLEKNGTAPRHQSPGSSRSSAAAARHPCHLGVCSDLTSKMQGVNQKPWAKIMMSPRQHDYTSTNGDLIHPNGSKWRFVAMLLICETRWLECWESCHTNCWSYILSLPKQGWRSPHGSYHSIIFYPYDFPMKSSNGPFSGWIPWSSKVPAGKSELLWKVWQGCSRKELGPPGWLRRITLQWLENHPCFVGNSSKKIWMCLWRLLPY